MIEIFNQYQRNIFPNKEPSVLSLTKELIKVPSVKGNRQAITEVLDITKQQLVGFTCESFEKNGDTSLLFYNRFSRPDRFRVLLNAHLDVVSGTEEQFNPKEVEGRLYGRGAQDMKSAAAGMILVFKYLAPYLSFPIGLQIVTDEETGGFNGTGHQVEEGVKADFMIAGESTDFQICNQNKGVLVFRADTYTGRVCVDGLLPGHAAYILKDQNAILEASRLLSNLEQAFPGSVSDKDFVTTINPAMIETLNKEHNKVPVNVSTTFDIRFIPADADGLLERIKSMLPPNTTISEETIVRGKEHFTDPNNKDILFLKDSIKKILGKEVCLIYKNGASDGRFFEQSIEFGPVGGGLHTEEEYVDIPSLNKYASILMRFLSDLK